MVHRKLPGPTNQNFISAKNTDHIFAIVIKSDRTCPPAGGKANEKNRKAVLDNKARARVNALEPSDLSS